MSMEARKRQIFPQGPGRDRLLQREQEEYSQKRIM
jgi:hypothetical protein